MGRYIDGFVIPVPKDRIDDYRRVAEKAAADSAIPNIGSPKSPTVKIT